MPKHRRRYHELRDALKTGDIVLFDGRSGFSAGIKWFTTCRWSHVGMVLRLDGHPHPLVLESLRLPATPDAIDGEMKYGVQLLRMCDRVVQCKEPMAVRHLNHPLTHDMEAAARAFHAEIRDRPYEHKMVELARAAYNGPFGHNTTDLSALFCSELVAEAFMRMGLLPAADEPEGQPSNEYVPRDFSTWGPEVTLRRGYKFGPEILLVD